MQRQILTATACAAFLLISIGIGCTKLDTTTLGSDLVTVDNVNTFADTLTVNATQGIFADSTSLQKIENHIVGNITTDLLFGKTQAAVYVQFKPTFYPFYFGNAGDTVINGTTGNASPKAGFDSAFICLSYKGAWGDTAAFSAIPQEFRVYKIEDVNFTLKTDTVRRHLLYQPNTTTLLGSAFITPALAKSQVKLAYGRALVDNQIRIKLTGAGATLAADIFNLQDSTAAGPNNAKYKDTIFNSKFNGFAITVNGPGNTMFYVNIAEAKSRMEFHFHKTNKNVLDTIVQSFQMYPSAVSTTIPASSSANYVSRDRSSSPITTPDVNNIFLQTAPGTFANLIIPQLTGYTNRIVHRAYLIVEQTPDNAATDNIYTAPPYLYLDLKELATTTPQVYKPVYFDLSSSYAYNPDATNSAYHPYPFGNIDIETFGGNALKRFEPSTGVPFYRYEINLTRYVQHIVTNGYSNYNLRLYAPFNYYYPQYTTTKFIIPFFNPVAFGRVRVGSGANPLHRMKMVVVYSKI